LITHDAPAVREAGVGIEAAALAAGGGDLAPEVIDRLTGERAA
jgi:hypothetical protein